MRNKKTAPKTSRANTRASAAKVEPVADETIQAEAVEVDPNTNESANTSGTFAGDFASAVHNFNEGVKSGFKLGQLARPLLTTKDLEAIDDKIIALDAFKALDKKIGSGAPVMIYIDGEAQKTPLLRELFFNAVIDALAAGMEGVANDLVKLGVDPGFDNAA